MPLVSCFFYGMESLSGINLYGQVMTLMFRFVWSSNQFIVFVEFLLRNNFQFLIYIVPSNSKVLKTSRLEGIPLSNFKRLI